MTVIVVAEKPSVARDLAQVVGARTRAQGWLHGNGYVVTWAIGHLVGLAQPQQMDPAWKAWRAESLPMLTEKWPLAVLESTKEQFRTVKTLMTDRDVEYVVCATDAGREGELIFRFIYEAAGCRRPVRRLWISSLTPAAISAGLLAMKDSAAYDSLAAAARGRAQADWLVGMNLSRAYTLAQGETLSVGRVQTPTLAMIVECEKTIREFVPEAYLEVVATFGTTPYQGTWFRTGTAPSSESRRLPPDGQHARAIIDCVRLAGMGIIESMTQEQRRMPPPLLYDLTELQRYANRLWGFSAQRTLELAQGLSESKKLLSYPRTDSRAMGSASARDSQGRVAVITVPGGNRDICQRSGQARGRRTARDAPDAVLRSTTSNGIASACKQYSVAPAAFPGHHRTAQRHLWTFWFPPAPGGGLQRSPRRRGCSAGDADRGGQVALLPAPGSGTRWDDAGGQSADRLDGGSGRKAQGPGPAGGTDPLRTLSPRIASRVPGIPLGRAGRDGQPSRAILLHSYIDRKTNEFFHRKNCPPVAELNEIFIRLTAEPQPKQALRDATTMDEELFDRALEKLWIHGGALVDPDESIRRGDDTWAPSYDVQVAHRLVQSEQMARFAEAHGCRMVHLVRHFGDEDDSGAPCGLCDACALSGSVVQTFRAPATAEVAILQATLQSLAHRNNQSVGTLYRNEAAAMERYDFEMHVSALVRGGMVTSRADVFEKDGKSIPFQRLTLTPLGRKADARTLALLQVPAKVARQKKGPVSRAGPGTRATAKKRAKTPAGTRTRGKSRSKQKTSPATPRSARVDAALRAWRKERRPESASLRFGL